MAKRTEKKPASATAPAPAATPAAAPAAADAAIVSEKLELRGAAVHYLSAGPADAARSLLLLHGASFHSGTWQDLGTIELMARERFRVIALDLPGFGKSPRADVDPESFLHDILPLLGLVRPIVVSPSMSGRFSYPLLQHHPEVVGGFVPIAPAATPHYAPRLKNLAVPTLIVWGEKDNIFPVDQAALLARSFSNTRTLIIPGAGHACYLDKPETFHRALLEFMKSL
jgi:abhydrolase domain-containing protein 14